jgi:DNA replication and repair protein RecF
VITSLGLRNFRSYAEDMFEFSSGVNIVVGPNASGKTNLLEAILFMSLGKSYRVKDLKELVSYNKEWSTLSSVDSSNEKRLLKLLIGGAIAERQLIVDQQSVRFDQKNQIPVVIFEPEHMQLLTGQPEGRRAYLDHLASIINSNHDKLTKNYNRALRQRNSLLKIKNISPDQLFVWDLRLSELSNAVVSGRMEAVFRISSQLANIYQSITGQKSPLVATYLSKINTNNYSSDLLKTLQKNNELDKIRGFTSCGAHRDDLGFALNNKPAEISASRGETRSLVLSLKIFEKELIEQTTNKSPIMLLDDVFSELDGRRRRKLAEALQNNQTFITSTDADIVVSHFGKNCHIIPLGG